MGTTTCKAGLVDTRGQEVALALRPTPWRQVATGAELDADALLACVLNLVRDAVGQSPDRKTRVVGVGVTSIGETGFLLDNNGAPIAPGIAWHDVRGAGEVSRFVDEVGSERFVDSTGLPPAPTWSVAKYLWLRSSLPRAANGQRWLSVAAWVAHALGGSPEDELSLSTRTGFLDLTSRRPWSEALHAAEAPNGLLSEPRLAGSAFGYVRNTGLPQVDGAVVTVAGHDHLAAAVGADAWRTDVTFDSCGTAEGFLCGVAPSLPPKQIRKAVENGLTVGWHVVPDLQTVFGFFPSGLALTRFLEGLGVGDSEARDRLDRDVLRNQNAGECVEITVGPDASLRVRGGGGHPDAALWRAALEAVATEAEGVRREVEYVAGGARRVVMGGGWRHSAAFRAIKKEVMGFFTVTPVREAGCRGAALLAGCAAGIYRDVREAPSPVDSER